MRVKWFILRKTIVFQGFRGSPSFSKGGELFPGGGDANFYKTYDFPGGPGPYPTSGSVHVLIFYSIKLFFLAPFNYVETHCI